MSRPRIICVTPIKNEEWILERFLRCTELWADEIILADQQSTDRSRAIAAAHPKVRVIDNPNPAYSEGERQKLLLAAAREYTGPRVIVALDADEILSAEVLTDLEWEQAITMPPGSVIRFSRTDLTEAAAGYMYDSFKDAGFHHPFACIDDGSAHEVQQIHSPRVPVPPHSRQMSLNRVRVLHYQFCDPARVESKHRWYRCYERLQFPHKSLVTIHRIYDWMRRIPRQTRLCQPTWFADYAERGIDMTTIHSNRFYWWDWEILRLFQKHGVGPFVGLDIWDVDWEFVRQQALSLGMPDVPSSPISAPDGGAQSFALRMLKNTTNSRFRPITDRFLDWFVV